MARSSPPPPGVGGEPTMIGRSPPFRDMIASLDRLAPLPHPVLILGETGTGKELAAARLHRASRRPRGPFVAINCAAIPESLAESELFGHVRGAFTGAHRTRAGAFSRADGGTLFLDEVAELPAVVQAKLLRVLETGQITPVGADTEVSVDVRIVAATCRDTARLVEMGRLREDLYHRLSVLELRIPPLRERKEDIPLLLEHFVAHASRDLGEPVAIEPTAITAATLQPWSGNIRALRNAVVRASALSGGLITARHLGQIEPVGPSVSRDQISIPRGDYASMRRALLRSVLAREGSIRRAARALGVPRSTLGAWLRQ